MKKPDLSKQAMGKFFLHHTEKLILGLCLVLFGVFLWMGLKSKPFDKASPAELTQMADRAETHMTNPASWDSIKEFRVGSKNVLQDIENAEGEGKIKASEYRLDLLRGIAVLTAESRSDPLIEKPTDLVMSDFQAPLLIAMRATFKNPYTGLTPVSVPEAAVTGVGAGGRGMGAMGGEDFGGDGEDGEEDEEMEGEDPGTDMGGMGMGGMGMGRGGGGLGAGATEDEEVETPTVDAGSQVQLVNSHTSSGINPTVLGISPVSTKPLLVNVVCGRALIDIQKQVSQYESLSSTMGYFPDRDKPVYQHVEVQRRVKGSEKWEDRSEWIQFGLPNLYPQMHQMPKAFSPSAPEVTAAENFDPVLTGAIPPIAMFDYGPHVNHPKLAGTPRTFPELKEAEEVIEFNPLDPAGSPLGGAQPGGLGGRGAMGGGRGAMGGGRGAMGGGPGAMGGGRGMQSGGGRGAMGGGRGMQSGGGRGAMGGGRGMQSGGGAMGGGEDEIVEATRSGNDFTDYINALEAKKPGSQYKLVRFFDVDTQGFKPGAVYEYRLRVWLGDPNNEDLNQEFVGMQGAGGGMNAGMNGMDSGMGMDGDGEMLGDGDDEGEFGGDDGSLTQNTGEDEEVFAWQKIKKPMLQPLVRKRLDLATEKEDPKTGEKLYTVSEIKITKAKNAEGVEEEKEEVRTVSVPKDRPYLRFARPSEWSDSTEITISSNSGQVATGKVIPPKGSRMKVNGLDVTFPVGEPASEVAVAEWSATYGTAIPTKQTAYRGDLLNYYAPAHIVNPITWRVYMSQSDSEFATGEDKFTVPIRSQRVVVDTMGGEELPLPRAEKMRHHRASEMLVMDAKGNFKISNDLTDRTTYRNLLLQPDESQTVGKPKRERRKRQNDAPSGGRGGGMGGGMGGFDPDDQ